MMFIHGLSAVLEDLVIASHTYSFFCDHLPVFAGILIFQFPGLESYLMRVTASYSCEELVAVALFELAADRDRVSVIWLQNTLNVQSTILYVLLAP